MIERQWVCMYIPELCATLYSIGSTLSRVTTEADGNITRLLTAAGFTPC